MRTVAADIIAVASLDEQGQVARQGLGVTAGQEDYIITCASRVDCNQGGVIMTSGRDAASDPPPPGPLSSGFSPFHVLGYRPGLGAICSPPED